MSVFSQASFNPTAPAPSTRRPSGPNRPQSLTSLIEQIRSERDADPDKAREHDRAVVTDETEDGSPSWGGSQRRKSSFGSLHPKQGNENTSMFSLSDDGPTAKPTRSPGRPHRPLSALSPLQSFSPLQAINIPEKEKPRSGHRREGSLTRSLSSKERIYASGDSSYEEPHGQNIKSPGGLFSRLTLVRAPSTNTEIEQGGMRRRSQSSSSLAAIESLAPFETIPGAPDAVPTTARGPRRSFAASSFSSMTPMSATPGTLSRNASFRDAHAQADRETQGIQRKTLSPEEVVELAKSLNSPTMDAPPGLQRRKSYGSAASRHQQAQEEPQALEPVEYVQLDEETLLPFADRMAEVQDLIEHPQNQQLFNSLKAAFPKSSARDNWAELLPNDWNYDEFILHLTTLDRVTCPDWAWVTRAREAVREHSIALWERLGVCLGCDADLLNAGASIGEPNWGGLGLNDLDDSNIQSQVWVEGLVAGERTPELSMTPTPLDDKGALPELGELSDEEGMPSMGGMETIGEDEDEANKTATNSRQASLNMRPTPAQVAGGRGPLVDPFASPERQLTALHDEPQPRTRSKSSVGLQIMTSPSLPHETQFHSPHTGQRRSFIEHDRQIGDALFISSFSNVGLAPSLGRRASHVEAGPEMMPLAGAYGKSLGFSRKVSGAGLSESAITFATDSSFSGRD